MKHKLRYVGLIFIFGFFLGGCYKDVILPEAVVDPEGPPQQVSFNTELAPLFAANCTAAGCHDVGAHKPTLFKENSYQSLVNGGFINTSLPKQSRLYTMINGEMKEYIPKAVDRQKVYDWIRNGAPNN